MLRHSRKLMDSQYQSTDKSVKVHFDAALMETEFFNPICDGLYDGSCYQEKLVEVVIREHHAVVFIFNPMSLYSDLESKYKGYITGE